MKRQIKCEMRDKKSIFTRNKGTEELVGIDKLNDKIYINAKNICLVLTSEEAKVLIDIMQNLLKNRNSM